MNYKITIYLSIEKSLSLECDSFCIENDLLQLFNEDGNLTYGWVLSNLVGFKVKTNG